MPFCIAVRVFAQIALAQDYAVFQVENTVAPARRAHIVRNHYNALTLLIELRESIENVKSRL